MCPPAVDVVHAPGTDWRPTTQAPTAHGLTWDAKGLLTGFTLPPERRSALYKLTGVELPDMVWAEYMTGHRMLIAPAPVSDQTTSGLLYKPRAAVERAKLATGAGWIISVGPLAGFTEPNALGGLVGVVSRHPADLLGARVTFKAYSGQPMRISQENDEWEGELLCIVDREVSSLSWEESV